ncbi:DUF2750 domain-containing protein [Gayadomonas joobiniege]|uniref:DUF2750 domain-containing protein n=1 Tax=Gayadomonas joobiniege TaxID=1234606 RepID=UPI000366987C|nr:DUF2750 domain-containing protein [Gayadomonas joobiniege]
MTDKIAAMQAFAEQVRSSQTLWGLTADPAEEDWVVVDSQSYEDTEVLLVWHSQEAAAATCTEEWSNYKPSAIPLAEYFDFWLEELGQDGVMIGLNWQDNGENIEVEMVELARVLAESGVYKEAE